MDCGKTGALIRALRKEQGLTQLALAEKLGVSDKAVSKWERGLGCPDLSLLPALSELFKVELTQLLSGALPESDEQGGSMKKSKFYICPLCGNISLCTGDAVVSCCSRRLEPLPPKKAEGAARLDVERAEDDWYITSPHPMTKTDYVAFMAFVTGDKAELVRKYPEWDLSLRLPAREHGTLYWYSTSAGLLYQYI